MIGEDAKLLLPNIELRILAEGLLYFLNPKGFSDCNILIRQPVW